MYHQNENDTHVTSSQYNDANKTLQPEKMHTLHGSQLLVHLFLPGSISQGPRSEQHVQRLHNLTFPSERLTLTQIPLWPFTMGTRVNLVGS